MSEKSGYRNGHLIYPISVVDHKASSESGGGGSVTPNSVGSAEIKDGSILQEDLNAEVKDKLNSGFATDNDINEMFRNDS